MKWVWAAAAVVALAGLFWLNWQTGKAAPGGYLYGMESAAGEAAYCLAVAERVREITRGQGAAKLERFVDEQIGFWRKRATGAATLGRMALAQHAHAPGVNEGAHLHLAIQDCGIRAVRFYGMRFASME